MLLNRAATISIPQAGEHLTNLISCSFHLFGQAVVQPDRSQVRPVNPSQLYLHLGFHVAPFFISRIDTDNQGYSVHSATASQAMRQIRLCFIMFGMLRMLDLMIHNHAFSLQPLPKTRLGRGYGL